MHRNRNVTLPIRTDWIQKAVDRAGMTGLGKAGREQISVNSQIRKIRSGIASLQLHFGLHSALKLSV